ncbi:hypothetical protein ACLKA6_003872 [Drosophila palustris]
MQKMQPELLTEHAAVELESELRCLRGAPVTVGVAALLKEAAVAAVLDVSGPAHPGVRALLEASHEIGEVVLIHAIDIKMTYSIKNK